MNQQKISAIPAIRRLPHYLRLLQELKKKGDTVVSGTYLSEQMKCEAILVRKDLAITGITGRPRIGFEITKAIEAIEEFLGWNSPNEAFLIGVGSLGSALLGYEVFQQHNLHILAAFDNDPQKFGTTIHGKEIFDVTKLPDLVERLHVQIGILAVPSISAQQTSELMVNSGIKGIWNFTPVRLVLSPEIIVQNEDLSSGFAILCKHLQSKRA